MSGTGHETPRPGATRSEAEGPAKASSGGSDRGSGVDRQRGDGWPWIRIALLTVLLVGIGGAVWYWREPLWDLYGNQERIREWVTGFGLWGPLVTIGLNVAQVLLAPVPGQFVGLVNGYLYGVWLGTLYSMVGLVLGTTVAMALGRWFGRPLVEHLVKPEALARWDRIARHQGPLFFFLVFLFPFLPDDIVCFVIGLSPLPIPPIVVLAALGRWPGVLVSCWVGAYATELPWWAWVVLVSGSAALAWLFWRYQSRLEAVTVRLIQRLSGRHRSTATSEPSEPEEGRSAPPGASPHCAEE